MRILDFSDGFTSASAPALGSTPASSVSVTPTGNISSTDAQSALVEVQSHVDTINAQKAAANGLASLDSGGHVPIGQLPSAALGALRYQGTLDASAGVYPSSPTKGDYYVISVAGTISATVYKVGDWTAYDGTQWDKIDNSQTVSSVAGRTGTVVLTKSDVGLSNVDNTSDATKNSATATLTNKTLTTPIVDVVTVTDQGSTPSTPSSGSHKIYSKSAGMYILDSTGTEKPIGSGSGGGSKNYLSNYNGNTGNGDFELNNTNGWSLFHTTLTGVIPSGSITSGATSFTVFGIASGTALGGTKSLSLGGASGLTAGQGLISDAFTIDLEDQAKVMTFKAYYSVVNGTMNFSGTSSNTWALYIYDVTNSAWIQPTGCYGMTQGSGVGLVSGTFQTTSNSTQYRLALLCINTTSGLTAMLLDDFTVGPQTAPIGAPITDWQSYTPTFNGFGTPTNVSFLWRRVGGDTEIRGYFTSGTATGVEARVGLPTGQTSSSILPTISDGGVYIASDASAQVRTMLIEPSVTYATFGISDGSSNQLTKQNGNGFSTSGRNFSVLIKTPIQGWSSNVQISSDTDTRIVATQVRLASSVTTGGIIIFDTIRSDSHGAYSTSTGLYKVPVSGWYRVSATINGNAAYTPYVGKNGTAYTSLTSGTSSNVVSGSTTIPCAAGDTLGLYMNGGSVSINGDAGTPSQASMSIERLSGASVIAAGESINCHYTLASSVSSNSSTPIAFTTLDRDTHGAWNGTTFTAPTNGNYSIKIGVQLSGLQDVNIYKNGSFTGRTIVTPDTNNLWGFGSDDIYLLAGETMDIRTGGAGTTTVSNVNRSHISIFRNGN